LRRGTWWLAVVALLAAMLPAGAVGGAGDHASPPGSPATFNLGLHLWGTRGADINGEPMDAAAILAELDAFQTSLAKTLGVSPTSQRGHQLYPGFYNLWLSWGVPGRFGDAGGAGGGFPVARLMNGLRDRGIVPMITWAPAGPVDGVTIVQAFADKPYWGVAPNKLISDGVWDGYITQFFMDYVSWRKGLSAGASVKGTPKQNSIILRPFPEMNYEQVGWSDGKPYDWPASDRNSTTNFGTAWQRIHDIRNSVLNGTDAQGMPYLLYSPLGHDTAHFPSNGSTTVDFLGFDTFEHLSCNDGSVPGDAYDPGLASMIRTHFEAMEGLGGGNKDFIVAEYGIRNTDGWCPVSPSVSNDAARGRWLAEGQANLTDARLGLSRIKSMGYWNLDFTGINGVNYELGPLEAYASAADVYDHVFDFS
jgi:hypothetical protein